MTTAFFQLPLSGSHERHCCCSVAPWWRFCFQLPLSGSQKGSVFRWCMHWLTFNSLSRDHDTGLVVGRWVGKCAFNSLSRDHRKNQYGETIDDTIILSTPSLGITSCVLWWPHDGGTSFQLPLSGSHFYAAAYQLTPEAFNSLSRDHFTLIIASTRAAFLSTPSLGITVFRGIGLNRGLTVYLSTPSLGITISMGTIAVVALMSIFQLPLSGSPR